MRAVNQYFAHSENDAGKKQSLCDHLHNTAELMKKFCCNPSYERLFEQTGLIHDIGKYNQEWQDYLDKRGARVPHAAWGAGFARLKNQPEGAFAIDGHHKGLPDKAGLKIDTIQFQEDSHTLSTQTKHTFLNEVGMDESDFIPFRSNLSGTDRDVLIRYLFSSLTDADWLDTERHFNIETNNLRQVPKYNLEKLEQLLEKRIASMPREGKINKLRNIVRETVLGKAETSSGFYSLSLPTGMGKTLTSVSWALRHAKFNRYKRIIIVLPFVNIIDQTAIELKNTFGAEFVLEHHSAYNEKENISQNYEAESKKKLATENWDYPIIVTTTVQFFDSLFSNKPASCRKIHNIAQSVVIFDEVQSLPKELIAPTLSMLSGVHTIMGTSFLFCTATQPAFEKRNEFLDGIDNIVPLVSSLNEIYSQTRRVNYYPLLQYEPQSIKSLTERLAVDRRSVLCVFNTKKSTLNCFLSAKTLNVWDRVYHLSTSMCPHHRKIVVESIKKDLQEDKYICVLSTQLIEAGVDISFPCVFRELSPLESIIQAAGRCNREGRLKTGNVYIFCLEKPVFPDKLYEALSQYTGCLLKQNIEKLYDYEFFTEYYAQTIHLFVDTDKKQINDARKNCDFKTVAGAYHIIDKQTTSLFAVNYTEETLRLFQNSQFKEYLSRDDYRNIQQFSVQVYDAFLKKSAGQYEKDKHGLYIWNGSYDPDFGITADPLLTDTII